MGLHRWVAALAALGVAALTGCTTDAQVASVASEFAGSEKCGTCHAAEFKTWKDTYHSRMVRTPVASRNAALIAAHLRRLRFWRSGELNRWKS